MDKTKSPNSFLIWAEIVKNPFTGYTLVEPKTKIALPLLAVMLLSLLSVLMLQPILTSKVYENAMLDVQYAAIEKKQGTPISEEMKEVYRQQLTSPLTKTITQITTFVSGALSYPVILLLSALFFKLISLGMKVKPSYGHFFRILLFALIISLVQALLKGVLTVTGNWSAAFKSVQTTAEFAGALTTPISLASLATRAQIGNIGYFLLDTFTDIFNWLYYVFLYAGLRMSGKMEKKNALILTIASAVLGVGIGLLGLAFM